MLNAAIQRIPNTSTADSPHIADAFAKVIGPGTAPDTYVVRFTTLSPTARALLLARIGG